MTLDAERLAMLLDDDDWLRSHREHDGHWRCTGVGDDPRETCQVIRLVPARSASTESLDDTAIRLYDAVRAMRAVVGHDHTEPWPCPVGAVDDALAALARKYDLWDRPYPDDLAAIVSARLSRATESEQSVGVDCPHCGHPLNEDGEPIEAACRRRSRRVPESEER